ncbi:8090_t:CDS:10, partial [Racocetra persica]
MQKYKECNELEESDNSCIIMPQGSEQVENEVRANVDLKPVLSIHIALQYIANRSDDPILAPVQKLLLHSGAERNILAQETCYLFLDIPLYHSSFSNARWTAKSSLKIYQERPVLLHICYQDLYQLTENDTITWTALYEHNIVEINSDPINLLGPTIDNKETEIGPDATINDSSTIGSYSIDKNYNWITSGSSKTANHDNLDSKIINYETLNENQKIVMGTADTGKSYFIKAIQNRLNMMAGAAVKSPVIVIAPTGLLKRLSQLQEKLQNMNYFTIDEKTMLSSVLDLFIYATSISQDLLSNDGLIVYTQFKEVYKLDVIEYQSGNFEEQQKFRDILLWLNQFSETTFILPKWSEVDVVNLDQFTSLKHPVAKILAVHSSACIMLTVNLWTETGLVNEAIGTVQSILYNEEEPPSFSVAVLISFDNYRRLTITTLEGTEVVLIVPIRCFWVSKGGVICSYLQIPVCLAWAITVYKNQGLTLPKAVIDLGSKEFLAGLLFVTISRVCTINGLIFKAFNFEKLQHIKKYRRIQERKDEEKQL